MYAEERHQAIADLVRRRGRLSVTQLAEEFSVTTETVRRDLSTLERAGVLRRVHGGAVPTESLTGLEIGVADRDQTHAEEKDRIAKAAAEFFPEAGGTLLLDAGTTTARVVLHVPRELRLSVYTNAVPIAMRVASLAVANLHVLPGRVRTTTHAAVGPETVAALTSLRLDVAFVGTNGISVEHGLSTPDHDEAAAKRAMVRCADTVVVVADSSKVGRENTVSFATLEDVDVLVTDAGISERDAHAFRRLGVEVVVA